MTTLKDFAMTTQAEIEFINARNDARRWAMQEMEKLEAMMERLRGAMKAVEAIEEDAPADPNQASVLAPLSTIPRELSHGLVHANLDAVAGKATQFAIARARLLAEMEELEAR